MAGLGILPIAVAALLQAGASETPQGITLRATRAVEEDSVQAVAGEWTSRIAQDPADRAAVLGLATLASLTYDYKKADSLFATLLAAEGQRPDRIAAGARSAWARSLRARGLVASADSLYERAVQEARLVGDTWLEVESLLNQAPARSRTSGLEAASSLLESARRLIAPDDLRHLALYYCRRAELARWRGHEAGPDATRGAELAGRAGDRRARALCLHFVAADHMTAGRVDSAWPAYARAIAESRNARDRIGLAVSLQWLGGSLRSVGMFGEARRTLLEAVVEGEASQALSPTAFALGNLADISLSAGDLGAAAEYAERAGRIHDRLGDRYGLGYSQWLKGTLAMASGEYEKARDAYTRSLAAHEAGDNAVGMIAAHRGFAHVALAQGELASAERAILAARRIARTRGLTGYDNALGYDLATVWLRQGQLARAQDELQAGLATTDEWQGDWKYYKGARLAEVYALSGDAGRAERQLTAAFDGLDSWRGKLNDQQLRVLAFQVTNDYSDPDLGIATVLAALASAGRVEAAFHLAERRRARELLDQLLRAEALGIGSPDTREPMKPPHAAPTATAAEVTAGLPDDSTAILEFVTGRGGEPTTLFVVTRAEVRAHVLAAEDDLTPVVDRLGVLLESGVDVSPLARQLGGALLDSALAPLPAAIGRLVIVPDGALHHVPFEALRTHDGSVLLERFTVALAPSASVAVHLWSREPGLGEARALVMADPAFGHETDAEPGSADVFRAAFSSEGGLPRLPASAREARVAARFAPFSTLLLREEASEARLKAETLSDFRILHFATHALVDEASLTRTALVLAPGAGEDGLVTAGDLARLALDADLVVLSACRTARGKVLRGEGVHGLASALLQAGARSVVASRWPVGDRAAVRFVESFYRRLADGRSVGDALREAQLQSLRAGRPAVEWAAFTIVGDPSAHVALPPPPSRHHPWVLVVGLGVLLIGLTLWIRTRSASGRSWAVSNQRVRTSKV